jgi:aconitate hydratase
MGVLPLQFAADSGADSLGLTGREQFDIEGLDRPLEPRMALTVHARRDDGSTVSIPVTARFDTPVEVEYYRNGGILQTVLRKLMQS